MPIQSKIVKLQDALIHTNIMVYGDSGIGKTVWCGAGHKVLFIAPEDSGTISAKRHGSTADKWPVTSWNDLLEAYGWCYEQIENGEFPYDTIAIDSLTEMQYMAMQHILKQVVDDNPNRDPDVPAIQDWQRYYIIFEKMVRAFNDLATNVVYTALARKVEDAEGEDFYVPDIQGKEYLLSLKIASLMTSFGHMRMELKPQVINGEETGKKVRVRRIYWEDIGTSRGKDRTKTLAPYTDNKNLSKIQEMIEAYEPPEPKKAPAKAPAKKAPATGAEAKRVADNAKAATKAVAPKPEPKPEPVDNEDPVSTDIAGNPVDDIETVDA